MAIRFRCQHCSGLMSISNRMAGLEVPCATCGETTQVPLEDIFDAAGRAAAGPFDAPLSPPLPIVPASPVRAEPAPPEIVERSSEVPAAASIGGIETPKSEDDAFERKQDDSDEDDSRTNRAEVEEAATESDDDDEAPALTLRRKNRIEDDMDLTPMVDVTFQLLIFFMVTASFAMQKSIQVPTPDPDQKGATQQMQTLEDLQGTSILVRIDAANTILIDDEPLADPAQLTEVLREKMRKEQKTELLLTAHTAALHRGVIAVIDAANEVGMQKIRLASRKGKDD